MTGIGSLITLLSLNLTLNLVQAGHVAGTLPITGATATTPIAVSQRRIHHSGRVPCR